MGHGRLCLADTTISPYPHMRGLWSSIQTMLTFSMTSASASALRGRATEGVEVVHKAMRLDPHCPDYWVMQLGLSTWMPADMKMRSPHWRNCSQRTRLVFSCTSPLVTLPLGIWSRPGQLWQASLDLIPWPRLSGSRQLFWLLTKMHLIGTICG